MHQTQYLVFPYKKSKKMIVKECNIEANKYADYKDQIDDMRFIDMDFLIGEDAAYQYIGDHDTTYLNIAVPYKGFHGKQLWLVKIEYHC